MTNVQVTTCRDDLQRIVGVDHLKFTASTQRLQSLNGVVLGLGSCGDDVYEACMQVPHGERVSFVIDANHLGLLAIDVVDGYDIAP